MGAQIFISFFAACVIVFPTYLITSAVKGTDRQQDKVVEKAISQGHVVTAVLRKCAGSRGEVPGMQSTRFARLGIYDYEYGGKRYQYKYYSENPPKTLTLYFLKNPKKAAVKGALTNTNVCWPLIYAAVAFAVYWIAF